MSTLRNKVSLIGRLGMKPEIMNLTGGYVKVKFSLATKEVYKDRNGDWKDNTQWHNISAWGKLAERIGNTLDKGQEVAVDGRLVNQSYESKTGEKRHSTEIEITDFLVLSAKPEKK